MTQLLLHESPPPPPHPRCPDCGVAMWLTRVSATASREEELSFECKACGEVAIITCRTR